MDTVVFTQSLGPLLGPLFGCEPSPLVIGASVLPPLETGTSKST